MLSGENCWRGGFLFNEHAKPIAAAAMGMEGRLVTDPVELIEKVVNEEHGDAFVKEAEAMIAEVVAAQAEERKRCEAFIAKIDALNGGQLKDDDTPPMTAITWCHVADARDSEAG
jgi:hypothetical protein